jgi:hypothetical protein
MERHDPLRQLAPAPEVPAPPAPPAQPKRSRKPPPLLRGLAEVSPESLAFFYGGPDQQPCDYQRHLTRAEDIRRNFTAFYLRGRLDTGERPRLERQRVARQTRQQGPGR